MWLCVLRVEWQYSDLQLDCTKAKYTVFQKSKLFDNNFGRCGPIFKILSPGDSWENSPCTLNKDFHLTCNMLPHYLVKVENPEMLPTFHIVHDIINTFN